MRIYTSPAVVRGSFFLGNEEVIHLRWGCKSVDACAWSLNASAHLKKTTQKNNRNKTRQAQFYRYLIHICSTLAERWRSVWTQIMWRVRPCMTMFCTTEVKSSTLFRSFPNGYSSSPKYLQETQIFMRPCKLHGLVSIYASASAICILKVREVTRLKFTIAKRCQKTATFKI